MMRIIRAFMSPAILFLCVLAAGCAAQQPRFTDTAESLRNATLRGEIKDALAAYEAEAIRAEKDGDWPTAINAFLQAAGAAGQAGQLQKAITLGARALDLAQRTQVSVLATARFGQGPDIYQPPPLPEIRAIQTLIRSYTFVRDFDKARALADRGLSLLKENPAGDPITRLAQEGGFYRIIGNDLLRRKEYEKAIKNFERAVDLQRVHLSSRSRMSRILAENSEIGLTGALVSLARAYTAAGRFDDALEAYLEASRRTRYGGTRIIQEREVFAGLANTYFQQRQYSLAIENFQKALALAEKQQQSAGIRSASLGLAAALRQTGKAAEAIPYYEKAIQQTESSRSGLQSENYRQSFFEGSLNAYVGMIESLTESGKIGDAFSFSERARSRSFLDLLGSKAQLSRSNSGLLEEERSLLERIAALKARMAGSGEATEDRNEDRNVLTKELQTAEQSYTAFLSRVRKENPEQASLMNVEPLTLRQVQERLDPEVSLLEYFVTPKEVFLWVVDKERVGAARISLERKDLAAKVTALRETIYQLGEKERFSALAQELHRLLIAPALPHIKGKELLIVPHDLLHYLPFQALQSTDNRYLIEKYPISYLSSASLMQFTQEKRRAMGDRVLAFGNPDLGDPEKNLEYAELEAQEIKSAYPQSAVYLKQEASEAKAKALSPNNDVIHFATHAELKEDDPLSSAILLTKDGKEDGRLETREIFGMNLKANLVVLSGCDTGLGKLSTGDELVGLTRAFIYAGTPSVIASLWKIDDSSTAVLMASFYKNLKTMTKAEALRQAQLQLIRGEARTDLLARRGVGGVGKLGEAAKPQSQAQNSLSVSSPLSVSTSHPYFWAPFILVGEGK